MNFGTIRLRGRPRMCRWQDEVIEDGRIASGEGWQEEVHNREEWNNKQGIWKEYIILLSKLVNF